MYVTNNLTTCLEQSGGDRYIAGYASVFFDGSDETQARKNNMIIRIDRGLWEDVLSSNQIVECWYNHSNDFILGSTEDDSLSISLDKRGARYRVRVDDTDPDFAKITSKINRGLIKGSSFQYLVTDFKLSKQDNTTVMTHTRAKVKECGPVNEPAMSGTGKPVMLSMDGEINDEMMKEIDRWERTQKILLNHA